MTAVRSKNVRLATWDEIDIDKAMWTIPAHKMKGNRIHRIPLGPRALAILDDARELNGSRGLIFRGRDDESPLSEMSLLMVMRMGLTAVPHGLRSSFRDWVPENTHFSRKIAKAALAHVTAATRRSGPTPAPTHVSIIATSIRCNGNRPGFSNRWMVPTGM